MLNCGFMYKTSDNHAGLLAFFFSVDHENFLLLGVHGSSKMRTSSKDILVKRGSIALQILVHIYLAGTSVILFMLFMVLCCKKL